MAKTAVRIPLQLGTSAMLGRLRASSFFLPSVVFIFAWAAIPAWFVSWFDDGLLQDVAFWVGFVPGLAVAVLALAGAGFALEGADHAKRQAPSDLVLDDAGVHVHGGAHDGVTLGWGKVAAVVVERSERSDAGAMLRLFASILGRLRLRSLERRLRSGAWQLRVGKRVLAEAVVADEVQSLRLLAATLRAVAGDRGGTATPVTPSRPDVVACSGCGGAVVPADRPEVTCSFCGAAVAMPAEIRERIRAHATARGAAATGRRIARLLDQPGATAAARWLWLGSLLMRLAWPASLVTLAVLAGIHLTEEDTLPRIVLADPAPLPFGRDLGLAVLVAVACFVGVPVALDAYFANRRALRLVTLDFGAVPPSRNGEAWSCRACAGPLPEGEGVLRSCAYCGADNVLGIDLRVRAAGARTHARSVAGALRHRRRARIRFALVIVLVAAGVTALGREIDLTAHAARWRPPSAFGCFLCRVATVHDIDGRRHRLTVTAEGITRERVVPASGTVVVECQYECEIRLGEDAYRLTDRATLRIEDGRLIEVPAR